MQLRRRRPSPVRASSAFWLCAGALGAQEPAALEARFAEELLPLLEAHCLACHGERATKGGLDLRPWQSAGAAQVDLELLALVRQRMEAGEMPPAERARPTREALAAALDWIDAALRSAEVDDPGRVSLRRLTRLEYRCSVRDLLGVHVQLEDRLPVDAVGAGFDTVGDLHQISPLLLEKYLDLAEEIARVAVPARETIELRCGAGEIRGGDEVSLGGREARALYSHGEFALRVSLPRAGRYRLELEGSGDQAGGEPPRLDLAANGKALGSLAFSTRRTALATQSLEADLTEGLVQLTAEFANDYYEPARPPRSARDRNIYLAGWRVVGPLDPPPRSAFQRRSVDRADGSGERPLAEIAHELLERAWRRPVAEGEVSRVLALAPPGADRDEVLRTAIAAALGSPRFLLRPEGVLAEEPSSGALEHRVLDGYELATRLSYFLWSSVPDDGLRSAAARGELAHDEGLLREVRRLLRDARASALVEGFCTQWLQLGRLEEAAPDPESQGFDEGLRRSMRRETELFCEVLLREDRPLEELVHADFAFLDERLARLYGVDGVKGSAFRRVPLADVQRGGLLAQAAILTLTSNPARTSPVKRGKWILEVLLDAPPAPPPPEAGALPEDPVSAALPLRERLERHRRDPSCASCHARMDALGFALEAYGPIGRRRERDESGALEAVGELPDGRSVRDITGLRAVLLEGRALERAALKALFVYALGRALEPLDEPRLARALDRLAQRRAQGEAISLRTLIEVVATSEAFRRRRSGGER